MTYLKGHLNAFFYLHTAVEYSEKPFLASGNVIFCYRPRSRQWPRQQKQV